MTMKLSIRQGVFETNSSSVHAIVILPLDEYNRWKDNNFYVRSVRDGSLSKFEVLSDDEVSGYLDEFLKEKGATPENYSTDDFDEWLDWNYNLVRYKKFGYNSYEEYYDLDVTTFETPSGDVMVAESYFGYDG